MPRKNPVALCEMEVGRRLRLARERSLLTQTQFAMNLAIGRERLASYESGRVPLPFLIGRCVCDQWGINPFWLANGENPQLERHFISVPEAILRENHSFRYVLNLASPAKNDAVVGSKTGLKIAPAEDPKEAVVVLSSKGMFSGEAEEPENYFQPGLNRVAVDRLELNPFVKQMCIAKYGPVCQACGMRFNDVYGEMGKDFIEVHHSGPIKNMIFSFDFTNELVPLCSNCHSMIHRVSPMLSVKELKRIIDQQRQ